MMDSTAPLTAPSAEVRMTRNSRALIASSAVTSASGLLFWIVAARSFGERELGIGGAILTAIALVAGLSTLGLRNGLIRYLPAAEDSALRLIVRSYATCALTGTVLAVVFLAGQPTWAPSLHTLRSSAINEVFFVVAVAAWTIFVLQDTVLAGLHRSTWVPIENGLYSLSKLGLCLVLAFVHEWGIVLAGIVPMLAIIGPLNFLIVRKLIPDRAGWRTARLRISGLARFAAGDHFADVIRMAGAEVVVLLILAKLGPQIGATFFIAVTIPASVALIGTNTATAFVAEASANPQQASALLRNSARRAIMLVVPVAVVAAIAAPFILGVFGSSYRAGGTGTFRLLILATIPQTIGSLAVGYFRLHRRVDLVIAVFAVGAGAPLAGALFGATRWGLGAVGAATLIGQTLIALAVAITALRRSGMDAAAIRLATRLAAQTRGEVRHRRRVRAVAGLLDELDLGRGPDDQLRPRRVLRTDNDTAITMIDDPTGRKVVRIALSNAAADGLARHVQGIAAVRGAAEKAGLGTTLVQEVIETGVCLGQRYAIETACPGYRTGLVSADVLDAAVDAYSWCHEIDRGWRTIDDDLLAILVDEPIRILAEDPRMLGDLGILADLDLHLHANLRGIDVVVSRTHGDAWLGNLLFDRWSFKPRVTAMLDWEDSLACGLGDVDLIHLWLSTQSDGLARVTDTYRAASLQHLLDGFATPPNPMLPAGPTAMLAWLAHTSAGVRRATESGVSSRWFDRNVHQVLLRWAATDVSKSRQRVRSAHF